MRILHWFLLFCGILAIISIAGVLSLLSYLQLSGWWYISALFGFGLIVMAMVVGAAVVMHNWDVKNSPSLSRGQVFLGYLLAAVGLGAMMFLVGIAVPGGTAYAANSDLAREVFQPVGNTDGTIDKSATTDRNADAPAGSGGDVDNGFAGFSFNEASAAAINVDDNCSYTDLKADYMGSEDTNPGSSAYPILDVYVDGYDRGDDDKYDIWSIDDLIARYGVDSNFWIVGDGTDVALAENVTVENGVAYPEGYLAIGNSGNTFVIDPNTQFRYLILRNAAFHLIPTVDLPGFTWLRVRHLECRGKDWRVVKVVSAISPFGDLLPEGPSLNPSTESPTGGMTVELITPPQQ